MNGHNIGTDDVASCFLVEESFEHKSARGDVGSNGENGLHFLVELSFKLSLRRSPISFAGSV